MKFLIVPISGEKRVTVDRFSTGCESMERESWDYNAAELPAPANTLADIFSEFVGATVDGAEICLLDPNIYCDTLAGDSKTVSDFAARGIYRASYNRLETEYGYAPNEEERARFAKDEIPLLLADYEVRFSLRAVMEDPAEVSLLLPDECGDWSLPSATRPAYYLSVTKAPTV